MLEKLLKLILEHGLTRTSDATHESRHQSFAVFIFLSAFCAVCAVIYSGTIRLVYIVITIYTGAVAGFIFLKSHRGDKDQAEHIPLGKSPRPGFDGHAKQPSTTETASVPGNAGKRVFQYKQPRVAYYVCVAGLFAGGAFVLFLHATGQAEDFEFVIIRGPIAALVFVPFSAVVASALLLTGLRAKYRRLEISPMSIVVPMSSFSKHLQQIRRDEIISFQFFVKNGAPRIRIQTRDRSYVVAKDDLVNPTGHEELKAWLGVNGIP